MGKMPPGIRAPYDSCLKHISFSNLDSYSLCTYTIQQKQCFHTCTVQQKQPSLQNNVTLPADQRASQISPNLKLLFLNKKNKVSSVPSSLPSAAHNEDGKL